LDSQSEHGRRSKQQQQQQQTTSKSSPDSYNATKNALDSLEASILAVVKFLAGEGVSRASVNELLRDVTDGKYLPVMERAQQYAKCVFANRQHHQDTQIVLKLLLTAWESLTMYMELQHKQAHRHFHTLRRMGHHAHLTSNQIERALKHKIEMAEQCCSSQKGLILAQTWERRVKYLQ